MFKCRTLAVSLAAVLAVFGVTAASALALPANFSDNLVTSVPSPTALAFTPDGRMLVTTQGGVLYIVSSGATTSVLDLSAKLCSNSERGLLGVAVDSSFASNHLIYLYYTFKKNGVCDSTAVNRVSRFTLSDTNVVDPTGETIVLDNIPSPAGNHNGGDLQFGAEGLLYVSVGDGGCDYLAPANCGGANDASRRRNTFLGKVLRVNRDGTVPRGNPFTKRAAVDCRLGPGPPGTTCREIFAWGLRNPFRFAFDPNSASTRFFINDVGQSAWEEIDLGTKGADYGWNVREGHCANGSTTVCGTPPIGMTDPIFDYGHTGSCNSITGGAFVPNGNWPGYDGAYLYADYGCGTIFSLSPNGSGGYTNSTFASGLGANSAVDLRFGPFGASQALYYTTYAGGGAVRRISYGTSSTPSSIYWGAWIDGSVYGSTYDDAPWGSNTWSLFEQHTGKSNSILHMGQGWVMGGQWQPFPAGDLGLIRAHGSIPMLDWGTWKDPSLESNDSEFTLAQITSGRYDTYIRDWATAAKNWGYPFFFRPDWEMNGNWYPWAEAANGNQPGDYVRMWRHLRDIFDSVGASNVTWVWCPNTLYPGSTALSGLYPGDAYVDWTCFDAYNKNAPWTDAETLYRPVYDQLRAIAPTKPILVGETATVESGGSKAAWITSLLSRLPTDFPQIKGIEWFNWNTDGPSGISAPYYAIETSTTAQTAFAAAIASSYFAPASFGSLPAMTKVQPLP